MEITQYEIALKSIEQLQSTTVSDLKRYAKVFELRGYSKLKKAELVELVFNASDVLRQQIINEQASEILEQQLKDEQKYVERMEEKTSESPMLPHLILKVINNLKSNMGAYDVANILFSRCKANGYAPTSIAKHQTRLLKVGLAELFEEKKIDFEMKVRIKEEWDKLTRFINYEQREKEKQRINQMAIKAERTIEGSDKVLEWALENINNTSRIYYQGIAFSLLTGRRMVEIFGTTEFEKDEVGIRCKGLAKKKEDDKSECVFVSLGDDEKLVDFINNFPKRGRTPKQVNGTISSTISQQFPQELKDLGIVRFKDCRDFYAGTITTTFKNVGARDAETFAQRCMGHDSSDTTKYYAKFDVQPITHKDDVIKHYMESITG